MLEVSFPHVHVLALAPVSIHAVVSPVCLCPPQLQLHYLN